MHSDHLLIMKELLCEKTLRSNHCELPKKEKAQSTLWGKVNQILATVVDGAKNATVSRKRCTRKDTYAKSHVIILDFA